jgi:hypothetical protein
MEGKREVTLAEIADRAGISEQQARDAVVRLGAREFDWGTIRLRPAVPALPSDVLVKDCQTRGCASIPLYSDKREDAPEAPENGAA